MLVKIGDKIYDPNDEPIMIILNEKDKQNIAGMDPDADKYCSYPESMTEEQIHSFMNTEDDNGATGK